MRAFRIETKTKRKIMLTHTKQKAHVNNRYIWRAHTTSYYKRSRSTNLLLFFRTKPLITSLQRFFRPFSLSVFLNLKKTMFIDLRHTEFIFLGRTSKKK